MSQNQSGTDESAESATTGETTVERTRRWRGGLVAAVVLVLAGLLDQDGTILVSAAIPLTYVAYGYLSGVTVPEDLRVQRRIEPTPAPPGRPVRVRLTVTNDSTETLSDVRVLDGVPEDLAVMDGTPRAGASLEPGESCTIEYGIAARRGEHDFEPATIRVRGVGGGAVATRRMHATGDATLDCRIDADAPPLYDRGEGFVGQLAADDSGQGVAFHSTREYRADDPANRIHWRQYAKRGTLATVNYERSVSATVVAVVDAREVCHVVPGPGRPSAVELAAYAATRAVTTFLQGGHDVGVAVVGLEGPGPAGLFWLPPGTGSGQRARALDLLRTAADGGESETTVDGETDEENPEDDEGDDPATDADGPDVERQIRRVTQIATPGAQLALFSPVLDDLSVSAVETWEAQDHPVVVLSPDVVSANTVSGQFAQVKRRSRLARCQAVGARTFDWRRGTPLAIALEYAFAADARRNSDLAARAATGGGGR